MIETNTHIYFWNDWLSNWSKCLIEYKNRKFYTSEQLFMYLKAIHFKDYNISLRIMLQSNPKLAKALGREIENFNEEEWIPVRENYMYIANYEKYTQNKKLKKKLINTGNKIIVEGSPDDKIWGVGIHYADSKILNENNWNGLNLLGKCLMTVRKNLLNEK